MTDKAYIVANEQQEREVLGMLEREGFNWKGGLKPTRFIPKKSGKYRAVFPYALINEGRVRWCNINQLEDEEIVFDGRKEEKMSEKYVVSREFMKGLEDWKEILRLDNVLFIGRKALSNLPNLLDKWWRDGSVSVHESNNRLIAIIRWMNGEDVFEVKKPKKWIVRSKEHNNFGEYTYVTTDDIFSLAITMGVENATCFDTKEEAESWANSHQEVIGVEE